MFFTLSIVDIWLIDRTKTLRSPPTERREPDQSGAEEGKAPRFRRRCHHRRKIRDKSFVVWSREPCQRQPIEKVSGSVEKNQLRRLSFVIEHVVKSAVERDPGETESSGFKNAAVIRFPFESNLS